MFSYEFHQLLLSVRFARDGDWLLHEGLIEIHFIQLQSQLLGHLKQQITDNSRIMMRPFICVFVCLYNTYSFFKCGKELNVRLELLCSFFKCFIVWAGRRWELCRVNRVIRLYDKQQGFVVLLFFPGHTSVCAFSGCCIHDICTSGSGNSWTLTST